MQASIIQQISRRGDSHFFDEAPNQFIHFSTFITDKRHCAAAKLTDHGSTAVTDAAGAHTISDFFKRS